MRYACVVITTRDIYVEADSPEAAEEEARIQNREDPIDIYAMVEVQVFPEEIP